MIYETPLTKRVASEDMCGLWSDHSRYVTARKLWTALARAQQDLGIDIADEQIQQLSDHINNIDYDKISEYEDEFKHDIVAQIHAYGDVAPLARPIIHLGVTSQYIVDNTDLILISEAISLLSDRFSQLITQLTIAANANKSIPTLAYTHGQPAQLTTIGRRIIGWAHDLQYCFINLIRTYDDIEFRGARGAVGTSASLLRLLGSVENVDRLNEKIIEYVGWDGSISQLVTQTYSRIKDVQLVQTLVNIAVVSQKIATDIRLLATKSELYLQLGTSQVGSSAMPYKNNPIGCEKICGLTRQIIAMQQTACATAAEQWLERSLDDSIVRRSYLPESFLIIDGIISILCDTISNLRYQTDVINDNISRHMINIRAENVIIDAVKSGMDRQDVHERLRQYLVNGGDDLLCTDPDLGPIFMRQSFSPLDYVGLAIHETDKQIQYIPTSINII